MSVAAAGAVATRTAHSVRLEGRWVYQDAQAERQTKTGAVRVMKGADCGQWGEVPRQASRGGEKRCGWSAGASGSLGGFPGSTLRVPRTPNETALGRQLAPPRLPCAHLPFSPHETEGAVRLTLALQWADIYGEIDRRVGHAPCRAPLDTF